MNKINEGLGAAKESLGGMLGNEKMQSQGAADKSAAQTQQSREQAKNNTEGLKNQASDKAETYKNNAQETAENAKSKAYESVPTGDSGDPNTSKCKQQLGRLIIYLLNRRLWPGARSNWIQIINRLITKTLTHFA
ncbi:hypothetical protein BC941DRAFT_509893 [Chlamydoabsidia padenii]|nr:hypothetical protein BC941DRAFT_509893 [Chlamydoabsidia padenii]